MIAKFVERFMSKKSELRSKFSEAHPDDYKQIVRYVIEAVRDDNEYDSPDPERIHSIDDGDYQGTLVFVIGAGNYQPTTYWYVKVEYGSCSGCDALEGIRCHSFDEKPTDKQLDQYMILALHIVQGLKLMGEDD